MPTYRLIDDRNCEQYETAVSSWLEEDFESKGRPDSHPWHNVDDIKAQFGNNRGMVTLDDNQAVVGFMVWSMSHDQSKAEPPETHAHTASAALATTTSTATTVLLESTQSTLEANTPEDDDAVIAAPPARSGSASPVGIFRTDAIPKTQTKSASVSPEPERRKPASHKRTADGDGDPGPDRKMRKFGS